MNGVDFDVEATRWKRQWLRRNMAQSTIDQYLRDVRHYLDWCAETGQASASLDAADAYISEREKTSTGAARMSARALKAYGKYIGAEYEMPNPYKRLVLPVEPEPTRNPTATEDDLKKLLDTCGKEFWGDLRDRAIMLMLANTGMRRGECADIQRSDLDLVGESVLLRDTKSGEHRRVRLPESVVGAVMRYIAAVERQAYRAEGVDALWLSTNTRPSERLKPSGLGQMLARRGEEANVDTRAHSFRRWHASKWLLGGGSETGLMSNSGWTTPAMIVRYTKANKETIAAEESRRLFD